ncbi:class I SAM-dependent methyltransferase [uncultured Tateyamaria sp.]|uniref:class I SAM-dependent methyltransferase n=1 Tax=uncultured Tateyamaria sp. TaxID=455651 RepID=UPI002605C0C8|nr:class I SAM-dependent methyltransferase [uncultured Tateyamaria sp.]
MAETVTTPTAEEIAQFMTHELADKMNVNQAEIDQDTPFTGLTEPALLAPSSASPEADRIISIEMMEHVRNWPALLNQMRAWLTPEGLAFVHVFSHREHSYLFDGVDVTAQHYFSGGFMPSDRLIYCFCDALKVKDHWAFDGTHYARTARSWLERLEANREAVLAIFEDANDASIALNNYHHWRNFFALVEESFGFRNGCEWIISQYLLTPRDCTRHRPYQTPSPILLHRCSITSNYL